MKLKLLLVFSMFITAFSVNAQLKKAFFELNFDANIDIRSTSYSAYQIKVEIENFGSEDVDVYFPAGGIFINLDSTEQNLVVLFPNMIQVKSSSKQSILIKTACVNPKRKPPKKGRTTWVYNYDAKIGKLIIFYHDNISMVKMATGSEYHETLEDQQNFLQMCVWVYYNAEKKQILDFATKYLFNGDKKKAEVFIDIFYPLAVTFIDLYKRI